VPRANNEKKNLNPKKAKRGGGNLLLGCAVASSCRLRGWDPVCRWSVIKGQKGGGCGPPATLRGTMEGGEKKRSVGGEEEQTALLCRLFVRQKLRETKKYLSTKKGGKRETEDRAPL